MDWLVFTFVTGWPLAIMGLHLLYDHRRRKGQPVQRTKRISVEWDQAQLNGERDAQLLHLDPDGVLRGPGNSSDREWATRVLEAKP